MTGELERLGEFNIIDLFRQKNDPYGDWVIQGMGDDCAVLDLGSGERLLVTTDMLTERVHFELGRISAYQLGFKCLAVSLSDIAAMGGEPKAAFLSMGLRKDMDEKSLLEFRDGLLACAGRYRVDLLGGDTVASQAGAIFNLTVLGRAREKEVVFRSGARPGDRIMVSGRLGDSAAGLHLSLDKGGRVSRADREALLHAHFEPFPQLDLGRLLTTSRLVNAMIDISDGLVQDLGHLCKQSGTGAEVDADKLPLSTPLCKLAFSAGLDPRDFALSGGEDYVLLFTVKKELEAETRRLCRERLQIESTTVGEIVEGTEVRVRRDGVWEKARSGGFDHFRRGK